MIRTLSFSSSWASTSMCLAIGDYEQVFRWLEIVADEAESHVIDEAVLNVLHRKMNYMNDPVLKEPTFRRSLQQDSRDLSTPLDSRVGLPSDTRPAD